MPKQQPDLRPAAGPRVAVRHVVEADRPRFVDFFRDEGFMVFSDGVLSRSEANKRFDQMIARCAEVSFAKQAIVIHADNLPSQNVCQKLGFRYWKAAPVIGQLRNLYRLHLPPAEPH